MPKIFLLIASLFAFLSVLAGAFGAHALRQKLSADLLNVFEVGVRYQMYHALALIGVAWILSVYTSPLIAYGGWLLVAGTVIFSGSLYLLALSGIKSWGAVTPVGGVILLLGWLLIIIGIGKS